MRIDVFFGVGTLAAADTAGRVVAVIDVLRASTSIAAALHNGARTVVPLDGADEVITRARAYERREVLLAGERKMLPIAGFDLGNSPHDYRRELVEGKTVLLTTTNGTTALIAVQSARDTVVASYVNFSPTVALLRAALRGGEDVTIICAGRDRQFSLEDAACAGRLVRHVTHELDDAGAVEYNDAARAAMQIERGYGDDIAALFCDSVHGRALAEAGFTRDLELCGTLDAFPVVPIYRDRQITRLGLDRE